ncbi:arginine--tRNA ligase [Streptomyces caniscabiei]|uniref:Arginine--tRNA ligase n=1 Tax=Streptomyces caniscabiei TaxID=2746961 RepID=A0A927L5E9_9ACTN|nr:arginine--tRNA ligase [Streptomyces caniscabiei]MBD9725890.1 arginine--tRNA ligase [Streptomyces caniscabiei]MDX3507606.1 arginine--tRNA ligase [Streptomyces caniscabiei]MDX3717568.1 arginine--tRNA ligase [Streptomyces caniscabiei]WEO25320.1 arginine--tRNA ligase [Streptomyces caniscabiei]
MNPADLAVLVADCVRAAISDARISAEPPAAVRVERPRHRSHGDYASNIALQLAKSAGRPAREIAEALVPYINAAPVVHSVEVAGPGFLNITLTSAAKGMLVQKIVQADGAYGRTHQLAGLRLNLEFVSANPTGPVHIGGARWAAVGDALARLLEAAGAQVTREYYFNDAGAQIDRFARSLFATGQCLPVPEDGYSGAYVQQIADEVLKQRPDALELPSADALAVFRDVGTGLMFREIKTSLADFGTRFDVYFNERELHDGGELDAAVSRLRKGGHVYEAQGAVWLRTTDFGDDKDRVLVKSDGSWTYFTADCAYYLNKRQRGFDRVVIMLGADHVGYVGRMRAMAACFGDDPDTSLEILIGQLVNLVQDGGPVRMSKRAGTVLTLDDLVEAVGVDAARYALARASVDAAIDLDLDLLTQKTNDNPVYYTQYAHARLCAVQRKAAAISADRGAAEDFDPDLLTHEREDDLLRMLAEFPSVVSTAAELREPHRIAHYLEQLAGTYHRFYDSCRVLPRDGELPTSLTQARLWLTDASRVVLRNGLHLLGVTAPERM